jgi:hypothetical protein
MERTGRGITAGRLIATLALTLSGLVVWLCAAAQADASESVTRRFNPTGVEQTFVVPAGVTSMHVRVVGGRGAGASQAAEVEGEVSVTPGATLYLEVAGNGRFSEGGFNGGGEGGFDAQGGGGASDVRLAPRSAGLSPDTRLIVAGGGAGGGNSGTLGGAAGEEGQGEEKAEPGMPGTATGGGLGGEVWECQLEGERGGHEIEAGDGTLGSGGRGAGCASQNHGAAGGGGGGGGYYGGGGGGVFFNYLCNCGGHYSKSAGGGGGSSLVPAGGAVALAPTAAEPVVELTFMQPEDPPAVVTGSGASILAHSATLDATVNPEDTNVGTCEFEYGTSDAYGESVPCSSAPGSGFRPVAVSGALEDLAPSTTYHYRIVATNGVGTSYGADREFLTAPHEAATVSELSPGVGPVAGGTTVTFTGTELEYVTGVKFGGAGATKVTDLSPSSLSAVTPANSGSVQVILIDDLGQETDAGSYTFSPHPAITKISEKKGPAAGGTKVVITGTGLAEVTQVLFGSTPGRIESTAATSMTVVSPPSTAGSYDITVVSSGGQSEVVAKAVFDFERPTVTAVSPSSGPLAGGTSVTITGTGFSVGSSTVFKFGKTAATSVDCTSITRCTMLSPAVKKAVVVDVIPSVGKAKAKKSPPVDHFTYE